jgi:glycine/D-amino acid oxidase-like deaminating enzyme
MTGFPFTLTTPPRHTGPLPDAVNTVVIGGGIIGVMTAWYLAEAGQKVLICEKGRVGGEQSGRNWGWIRQQGRDLAELPTMMEAISLWQGLSDLIGPDLGFRQEGVLYLTRDPKELAGFDRWRQRAAEHGLTSRLLGASQARGMVRGAVADWIGGLFTPSDARAEPWRAVPLIAEAAVSRGIVIRENCAVRGLITKAGAVAGVATESGDVACEQVVLAGGAWSSLFLAAHGVRIPQLSVLASVGATENMAEVAACNAADDHFAFRPRADGGYSVAAGARHDFYLGPDALRHFRAFWPTFRRDWRKTRLRLAAPRGYPDGWTTPRRWGPGTQSPFEAMRILSPKPNMGHLGDVIRRFGQAMPELAMPELGAPALKATWAGMIDVLPDEVPIIDHVPGLAGLVLATGMAGHGFGIGPGFGRVVADMVLARTPRHDLSAFRFSRFNDGSPRHIGTAL